MSYSYEDHLAMTIDERRMWAYREAIPKVVADGDVVLDLGAGGGIMTFLALEAGASHVHAVEWSDSVDILRRVAREAGATDRITVHREDSRRISLPEPADVIIADVRGALPIFGEGLAVVLDARARLLAPGGRMIPIADRLFVAPVEHPAGHDNVSGWGRAPIDAYACMVPVAASRYTRAPFGAGAVLAPAAESAPIRYDGSSGGDLSLAARFETARAGVCHGLGAWFEAELAPGVALSTAPEHGESVYGQAYFPVERPVELAAGDLVGVELSIRTAPAEPVLQWAVRVESGAGAGYQERRCSIDGEVMSLDALRKRAADHAATLGVAGRVALFVLERMQRRVPNGAIAEQLHAAFPERFATVDAAAVHVGKLAVSFSE